MADFSYFASQAPVGHFMCALCYDYKPLEESWKNWDVCQACHRMEQKVIRHLRWKKFRAFVIWLDVLLVVVAVAAVVGVSAAWWVVDTFAEYPGPPCVVVEGGFPCG